MRKAKSAMGSFAVGRKYRKAVFKIGSVTTHSKNGRRHNTWRKKLKMKYRRRKKQFLSRNGRRHDKVWKRHILDCKKIIFPNVFGTHPTHLFIICNAEVKFCNRFIRQNTFTGTFHWHWHIKKILKLTRLCLRHHKYFSSCQHSIKGRPTSDLFGSVPSLTKDSGRSSHTWAHNYVQ